LWEAFDKRLGRISVLAGGSLAIWFLLRDVYAPDMATREAVNAELGLWAARFLIAGLSISPLAHLCRVPRLKRLRRPLGVAAAAFALLHALQFLAYSGAWPDDLSVLWRRRYLAVGVAALVLLAPLAATSFNAAIRWITPRRWVMVHWLVYPAALLTLIHELAAWSPPLGEAGVHALLLAALLGWRLHGMHWPPVFLRRQIR
jgi:sulfoxide reductase heme-binding subunit YedZ